MPSVVSIIMPVLNGDRYIGAAIESVIAQSHAHWELLVVDDGSTDGTAGIVQSFNDPRIRYTYQENRGQAAALNRGLDLARGEYITTLDADDTYPLQSLKDRVAWLDMHPTYGGVYGNGYYCDELGQPVLTFEEYRSVTPTGDIYDHLIVSPLFAAGANVMQRRSAVEQYNLRYDETIVWCQDWDFYIRLAEHTMFGYVDTISVNYRIHMTNMTTKMPEGQRLESLIRTKHKVLNGPRLSTLSMQRKSEFFYSLLVVILCGRVNDQFQVIDHPQFHALPKLEQSRLLRLMANEYVLSGEQVQVARKWLRSSWKLAPLDFKTGLVAVSSIFSISLARAAITAWRGVQDKGPAIPSPFQLALDPALAPASGDNRNR